MKPETKIWWNDRALIVRDWIVAHPWFVVGLVMGFALGQML